MKPAALLVILALALPTIAFATTSDTNFGVGGVIDTTASTTGTPSAGFTFSITSQLLTLDFAPATGTVTVTTGTLVGNCASSTGCTFIGGSLEVDGAVDFKGTFNGTLTDINGVITIKAIEGGSPVRAGFIFVDSASGDVSGDFTVMPEPGTVGLLGTGVGFVGMLRRRLRE